VKVSATWKLLTQVLSSLWAENSQALCWLLFAIIVLGTCLRCKQKTWQKRIINLPYW